MLTNLLVRSLIWFAAILSLLLLGYPVAAIVVHGLDPTLWPNEAMTPGSWFDLWRTLDVSAVTATYWMMLIGRSPAFASVSGR